MSEIKLKIWIPIEEGPGDRSGEISAALTALERLNSHGHYRYKPSYQFCLEGVVDIEELESASISGREEIEVDFGNSGKAMIKFETVERALVITSNGAAYLSSFW